MNNASRNAGTTDEYITVAEFMDFLHRWKLTIGVTVLIEWKCC